MQQADLAAAQHLLSTYSMPCLKPFKIVDNYGLKELLKMGGRASYRDPQMISKRL
jgi:hypothetical protein